MEENGELVSLYNRYLAHNEIGRRYSNRIRFALLPIIDDAVAEGINLRELEAEMTQTVDTMISEAVLARALQMKQRGR